MKFIIWFLAFMMFFFGYCVGFEKSKEVAIKENGFFWNDSKYRLFLYGKKYGAKWSELEVENYCHELKEVMFELGKKVCR